MANYKVDGVSYSEKEYKRLFEQPKKAEEPKQEKKPKDKKPKKEVEYKDDKNRFEGK